MISNKQSDRIERGRGGGLIKRVLSVIRGERERPVLAERVVPLKCNEDAGSAEEDRLMGFIKIESGRSLRHKNNKTILKTIKLPLFNAKTTTIPLLG